MTNLAVVPAKAGTHTAESLGELEMADDLRGTWLHLCEWEISSQPHRLMRSREADVGEEWTKPAICLDDPFVHTVAAASGNWLAPG